jgi:hypothetical protein
MNNKANNEYTDIVSNGGMDPRTEYEADAKEKSKREAALTALAELGEEMERGRKLYEHDNDTWWNSLTEKEREDAFYAVIKRVYRAEVTDRGTYRWALYDVFGFDAGMYGAGMDCGYMALHNIIFDGLDLEKMKGVDRFEVIDEDGRVYTRGPGQVNQLKFSLQDDERTLKVFVNDKQSRDV